MQTQEQSLNIFAEHYKKYFEKRYSVIPAKYQSKMPAIKNWTEFCHRLPTTDEVMSWIRNFDKTNIDVVMGEASGVIGLDLDTVDQRILDVILPILPESPCVKKGSKGETRFFKYNGEQSQTLKFNGETVIEILSTNKKSTMPPSKHPNGCDYIWTSEKSLVDVDKSALPFLPPMLFAHLESMLKTTFPDLVSQTYGKTFSGRNDELSSYCGTLIANKVAVSDAVMKLIEFDAEKNEPPLFTDANEFKHTEPVTNALIFYTNHLNTTNSRSFRDSKEYEVPPMPRVTEDIDPKPQGVSDRKKLSEIMSLAPTVLKSLHQNLLNNSWIKQDELALGALLSLTSTLVSRKVVFNGLSPNLYVLNISSSGSGKDKPQAYVKEILINMRADSLLGSGDYVSDASLMDGLANKPVRLDILDEAGGILRSVNSGKSEYNGKMADVLAELYTSSNTKYLGRSTAEGNKGACYRPNVNVLASTTPTGFSEGVSRTAIEKGLMGRFLIFLGDSEAKAQRLKTFPKPPQFALEQLKYWYGFRVEDYVENAGELELGGITQSFIDIEATKAAHDLLDVYFEEFDLMRRETTATDPKLPIVARLYQQMVKLIIVSACLRTIQDVPVVQKEDVQFGYELIKYYFENVKEVVDKFIFENRVQMNSQKVLNIIEAEGGLITKTDLYKKTRYLSKRDRENIIEDLEASSMLRRDVQSIDGTMTIVFRRIS